MQIKLLEICDKATFIPAMAIKLEPRKFSTKHYQIDSYYLRERCGYECKNDVVLMNLNDPWKHCAIDKFHWLDRTYMTAHSWIVTNWDIIENGDVIDVEFILGETAEKKVSERLGG